MKNLLEETIKLLSSRKLSPNDVLWVGLSDGTKTGSWDDFSQIANIEYDNGYGGNEIDGRLVIVGTDWWLSRGEYDGSEWWNFNRKPEAQSGAGKIDNILER